MCERKETGMNTTITKYNTPNAIKAWILASLRIMWFSIKYPGKPIVINYTTGDVWLENV